MNYGLMRKIAIFSLVYQFDDVAKELAVSIGRQIARNNGVPIGFCSGLEHWVAMGAREEGGLSIGFSLEANKTKQLEKFSTYPGIWLYNGPERSRLRKTMEASANAAIFLAGYEVNSYLALQKKCQFEVSGILALAEKDLGIFREIEVEHRILVIEHDPVQLVQKIFKYLDELKHAG